MASSRKSKPSRSAASELSAHVAARLAPVLEPGDRLALGLSGGIDSIVLLDVLARLTKRRRFTLHAVHVNHHLSPNAAQWARFCRAACRARKIEFQIANIQIARGNSLERAAREARYDALRATDADYIVLAHNADDQAETVLLQLLRGAGVKGLAAMPFLRNEEVGGETGVSSLRSGSVRSAANSHPFVIRPFLEVSRAQIEQYAHQRKLTWIDDESNADTAYQRNWLRHEVLPLIASREPGYRATLTRAARHFGEAGALLDDLARIDAGNALESGTIRVGVVRALSQARAKNVLRLMIASRGWTMPQANRLQEALRQALSARADANVMVDLGDCELRRHRDTLYLRALSANASGQSIITWRGEDELVLPALGGILSMTSWKGRGIGLVHLRSGPVTIRGREGGERLQCNALQPRRTVKNLLQEAAMPVWERARLPFIYLGQHLICVPGVGVEHRYRAAASEAGIFPVWRVF